MKTIVLIGMIAGFICLAFIGCGVPVDTPVEAEVTQAPAPLEEPITAQTVEQALKEALFCRKITLSSVPDEVFSEESPLKLFQEDKNIQAYLPMLASSANVQLSLAVEQAKKEVEEALALPLPLETSITSPNWQLVFTLLCESGSKVHAEEAFFSLISVSISEKERNGSFCVTVKPIAFSEIEEAFETAEEASSARFLYAYLLTAYDSNAEEREPVNPPAEGNLKTGIAWPLESYTRLRKTWYADRDNGVRRHMGTDIWADENTEIYSCTDGIVTKIESGNSAGNAVVVKDEYGYEFHYYHMVRLTDFLKEGQAVKKGQLIGHVGNTGNSDRDHLHLSIIAPNGMYLNPYPYLEAVEPKQ